MRRVVVGSIALLVAAGGALAQIPVTGVANTQLKDIAGTATPVTIVLQPSGAEDPNCSLLEVGTDYIAVRTESGERHAYLFKDIQEVRVQDGKIDIQPFKLDQDRGLTKEDRMAFDHTIQRAAEIFANAQGNQALKMDAAALMGLGGMEEGRTYLEELTGGNDIETALEAILRLYVMGADIGGYPLIEDTLNHGNRNVKRLSTVLAGLTRNPALASAIEPSTKDRLTNIAATAIVAMARIGERSIVPKLLEMIGENSPERAQAASDALVMLGGEDVIEILKQRMEESVGFERHRILQTLFLLEDPAGQTGLLNEIDNVPTLARSAAIVLAAKGNYQARVWLNDLLAERYERTPSVLRCRGEVAGALIVGGDRKSIAVFQDLLRSEDETADREILIDALRRIAVVGKRNLTPITQSRMGSSDLEIALAACQAAVASTDSGYRDRLEASWYRIQLRDNCEF